MNEYNSTNMKGHLQPGTVLQGNKYRIVRFIASGGFGCTYEGVHVLLNKRVAIKEFFVKELCNRDETNGHVVLDTVSRKTLVEKLRDKFIREARALCEFYSHGIVNVFDIFEENGTAYFVMDYIDGRSLNDIVENSGALPEAEAVGYIRQVAEALREVHSHNRLHLDIKAGNIMVDKYNKAILIDFGASKQYDRDAGQNTSTLLGYTCGYAPPEQMSNSVKNFHACTDLYALGATLYKLVTGDTPPDAMTILSEGGLQVPRYVSPKVANAIRCAMHPVRNNRPQNVDEFLALLDDKGTSTTRPDEPTQWEGPGSETTVLNRSASRLSTDTARPAISDPYTSSSGENWARKDKLTSQPEDVHGSPSKRISLSMVVITSIFLAIMIGSLNKCSSGNSHDKDQYAGIDTTAVIDVEAEYDYAPAAEAAAPATDVAAPEAVAAPASYSTKSKYAVAPAADAAAPAADAAAPAADAAAPAGDDLPPEAN